MELKEKRFEQLSVNELFEIYKLRSEVFVVEQNCVYQDIDDVDKVAIHLWLEENEHILAYLRVIPKGVTFAEVALGRVIAKERRKGYGTQIVQEGIRVAKERFAATAIELEAQVYAKGLYEKQGFVQVSEPFLEDGIEHIKMRLECD